MSPILVQIEEARGIVDKLRSTVIGWTRCSSLCSLVKEAGLELYFIWLFEKLGQKGLALNHYGFLC